MGRKAGSKNKKQEAVAKPEQSPEVGSTVEATVKVEQAETLGTAGGLNPPVPLVGSVSAEAPKKSNGKIELDAEAFHRMVVTVVKSPGSRYSSRSGITLFGKMRGGQTTKEFETLYRESLAFVAEANKRQKGA